MKERVFNRRLILYGLIPLFFLSGAVILFAEGELLGLAFLAVALAAGFVILLQPYAAEFGEEGLTVRYCFGFYEFISWGSLRDVSRVNATWGDPFIQNFCFFTEGVPEGKRAFFTRGEISANRKTGRLLRDYWWEDFEKRKKKASEAPQRTRRKRKKRK